MMTIADSRSLPPHHLLSKASLFLDLDGTLIEIASRPDAVTVDAGLITLLERLLRHLDGRVVVVSGRSAAEVKALLRGMEVAVAGSHGAEIHFANGSERSPAATVPSDDVVKRLQKLAARHPGVLIETKPFGFAIHFRLAPGAAQACEEEAERISVAGGYDLQAGKQVIELKTHTLTKGDAVRAFMVLEQMAEGRPLFIGDDLTDEAGFRAAKNLGGAGILVGVPRPTHASYRLADVSSALHWLEQAMAAEQ